MTREEFCAQLGGASLLARAMVAHADYICREAQIEALTWHRLGERWTYTPSDDRWRRG
jgi:hypothetical protein